MAKNGRKMPSYLVWFISDQSLDRVKDFNNFWSGEIGKCNLMNQQKKCKETTYYYTSDTVNLFTDCLKRLTFWPSAFTESWFPVVLNNFELSIMNMFLRKSHSRILNFEKFVKKHSIFFFRTSMSGVWAMASRWRFLCWQCIYLPRKPISDERSWICHVV